MNQSSPALEGESQDETEEFNHTDLRRGVKGFPGGSVVKKKKKICLQCRRHWRDGFNPWMEKIPWKRRWQPTPVFLPGKSHGQKSLAEYSPWGHKESDRTDHACYATLNAGFL